MWDRLTRRGDAFDERDAFARIRTPTREAYKLSYAQWLRYLLEHGVNLEIEPPDKRASVEHLRGYHHWIAHLAIRTQTLRFTYLHRVLSNAFPDSDWRALKNAVNHLTRQDKANGRSRHLTAIPTSDRLLDVGLQTIREARSASVLRKHDAIAYRNGLIVALLACHAPRRRSLTSLELGANIRREEQGYGIWLSADEMKAGQPYGFRLSDVLTDVMDDYLSEVRPLFPNGDDPDHGALWLSFVTGCGLGPQGIKNAVAELTEARIGQRITPHAFRHAALTMMANAQGFDLRHGQAFLDHRTPEISERHYNLATQLDAGRAYAKLLETTRRNSRRQECGR